MTKFIRQLYRAKLEAVREQTVGASAYTYTNTSYADESVAIIGGTISEVAVSRNGTNFYVIAVAASTAGLIHLCHGDKVKVTYSSAPTMQIFPG